MAQKIDDEQIQENERSKFSHFILEIKKIGKSKLTVYLIAVLTIIATTFITNLGDDSYNWLKKKFFNATESNNAIDKPPDQIITEIFGTHTINVNTRKPEKVQIGECPGPDCYIIFLGKELISPSGVRGITFFYTGDGFLSKESDSIFRGKFMIKNIVPVICVFDDDGNLLFFWIDDNRRKEYKKRPIGFGLWIPFMPNKPLILLGKKVDLQFEILSDSINNLKLKLDIAEGSLCSRKEFENNQRAISICKN
jgi:hypothetical protein